MSSAAARLQKKESGVVFTFPATHAVDGDAWLAPLQVKSCDFLWRRTRKGHDYLEFIEAKSSSPAPVPAGTAEDARGALEDYCQKLAEKLVNTLVHVAAHLLHRADDVQTPLPAAMTQGGIEVARWRFVLIVPGHQDAWLPPLRDAVRRAIRATVACGRLEEPLVLNTRLATRFGLTLTSA